MHGVNQFLVALTAVLCVAAVTTIIFHRLKQPVVLGYLLAGMIVGPHLPIPVVADPHIVQGLSELGVILLMFAIGLEFSFGKLVKVAPVSGITAIIETSLMMLLGLTVARAFGWTQREALFTAAVVAISSTTIVAKAFDELGIKARLRELVVGILIVEDVIAIVLMAGLTAFTTGQGLSPIELATTVGRLGAFLAALIGVGMFVVPRATRAIVRLQRSEVTIVASVGFAFGVSLLAQKAGYSGALGAFLAGALISESGLGKEIEHLIHPLRDIFAAVFFVSVGMMIDPALVREHWLAIVVLTAVVMIGKFTGVTVGAFITGNGTRTSVQAGVSLAQIGEFSFIIASLGLALKATGGFLYPVAIAVSALTSLTTPLLIRRSGQFANFVDRKLPKSLQTFAALYASWLESLSTHAPSPHGRAPRRMLRIIFLDVLVLLALTVGVSVEMPRLLEMVSALGWSRATSRGVIVGAACLVAIPFVLGLVRNARLLGVSLAERALPPAKSRLDLAAAPRRALVVTFQLACVIVIGIPFIAITQPFIGGLAGVGLWAAVLAVMAVAFWRSATNLEGHVRAGAQVIIEAVARGARRGHASSDVNSGEGPSFEPAVLLPGLGDPVTVRLEPTSPAVGKTLAELNLRGVTGATVLALRRGESEAILPSAHEKLLAGDVLAIAGTHEATDAARQLLSPV